MLPYTCVSRLFHHFTAAASINGRDTLCMVLTWSELQCRQLTRFSGFVILSTSVQ